MLIVLKLWKVGLGLLVGLLIGWFVMMPIAREAGRTVGHDAGAAAERIIHEEARRRAEAKAEADRRSVQAKIDAVERAYHQRTAEQAMQLDALEASILQETSRDPTPPAAGSGGACPAAVPRRLRDALAGVGAAAPRHDPAGPHGGVP